MSIFSLKFFLAGYLIFINKTSKSANPEKEVIEILYIKMPEEEHSFFSVL